MQMIRGLAVAVILLAGSSAWAEIIDGYTAARHDLFAPGTYPNTSLAMPPVPNPTFYLNAFDFSGVGWVPNGGTTSQNVAMISPHHFVSAAHYSPGVGATIGFRAKDGSYLTRTVSSQTQIGGSDVLVGELNMDLPTGPNGVANYPIPTGTLSQFAGQTLFMMGQHGRIGRNLFWDVQSANIGTGPTQYARTDFDPNFNLDGRGYAPAFPVSPPTDEFGVEDFDSGSPTFMPIGGQLALLGSHFVKLTVSGTLAGSGDSYLPAYFSQLSTELSMDGLNLQTIPVPEPTSMALCGIALAGLAGRRLFSRRRR